MDERPLPPERLTLPAVAQTLGMHPFTVARVLGHAGELPPGLRFEQDAGFHRVLDKFQCSFRGIGTVCVVFRYDNRKQGQVQDLHQEQDPLLVQSLSLVNPRLQREVRDRLR